MANVSLLHDIVGRPADSEFHLHRVFEQCFCELLDFGRHGGGEHDGLAVAWQITGYLEDVVAETHIEHTVGLVEYEERHMAEVGMPHGDMADESSWSGDNHVSSQL